MYKSLIKPFLFKKPAEEAHYFTMSLVKKMLSLPMSKQLYKSMYGYKNKSLNKIVAGLHFENPLGLAAGFDKDGKFLDTIEHMGFGFLEIGTVTPKGQTGNPKPRLFRLPEDKALINRMGFNNEGVEALVGRLKKFKNENNLIIGGNIGKNKDTALNKASEDYLISYKILYDYVDYFTINISSPNTPGLRSLQDRAPLEELLSSINNLSKEFKIKKPTFLKIAPDLTETQIDEIIEICLAHQIDGIIATNTTIDRSKLQLEQSEIEKIGAGGLSGAPLTKRSRTVVKYIRSKVKADFVIIGVGGICSAQDARAMIDAGADLIQIYSGMIYEGPALISDILKELA